jgi:hypothetical protein
MAHKLTKIESKTYVLARFTVHIAEVPVLLAQEEQITRVQ